MKLRLRRPRPPRHWEIRIATPADGTILLVGTSQLTALWAEIPHTNDGYVDLLEFSMFGRLPGMRIWVKPEGWTEPDRAAQLDGTGALPDGYRW